MRCVAQALFAERRLNDFVPNPIHYACSRTMANQALAKMNWPFAGMYDADLGGARESIAPEKLWRGHACRCSLTALFRWFVGLAMADEACGPHGVHLQPQTTDPCLLLRKRRAGRLANTSASTVR